MGGGSTTSRSVVQSAGHAFRLEEQEMMTEFYRAGPVLHLLLRYTQALITQMSQTAVCNRHHSIDQQLCRWLLLSLDRLRGHELVMTQELMRWFCTAFGDYVVISHSIEIILLMQSSGKYFIHLKMLSSDRLTASASLTCGFIAEASNNCINGSADRPSWT
jgi:hypothetical protein